MIDPFFYLVSEKLPLRDTINEYNNTPTDVSNVGSISNVRPNKNKNAFKIPEFQFALQKNGKK